MKQFKNILYVTEPTADQASAVERAVTLAENNQAKLTILAPIPPVSDEYKADAMTDHMKNLESLIKPYRNRLKVNLDVMMGTAFLEIIRAVLRNGYDLVIKIAENPIFLKRLFGSDDMHLLRKCPCPVWFMKSPEKPKYNCILAAVDFDLFQPTKEEQALNRNILELASSLSVSEFAALHLVHAWEAHAEATIRGYGDFMANDIAAFIEKEYLLHQKGLYRLCEMLRDWIGNETYNYLSPLLHLPKGSAKKVIAQLAVELQADLVVMGTIARTGISGFIIGNTAVAILEQLTCSVLAIKPTEFKTPVKLTD